MEQGENIPPSAGQPAQPAQPAAAQTSAPPSPQKTNVLAILGLIFGIIIPFQIVGIILSIIALVQIKKNPNQKGKGLAMAGLIIGCVLIILFIVLTVTSTIAILNTANAMTA